MSKRTSAAGVTARGNRGNKNEERARSPQLTGGEGFTYEDVIAAYFLAALLREEAALAQPGLVTRVAVQQDRQSEPMDDVIVDSAAGERYRLSLQV
jgi:CobQ-like glutamine amidotransferase family enzyme